MSFEDSLIHTITYEPPTGRGLDGKTAYGTPQSRAARIDERSRVVLGPNGQEIVKTTTIFLDLNDGPVDEKGRITLPDGSQPTILSVDTPSDGEGPHHIEVTT